MHPLGRAFDDDTDLVPLFLLRYDRDNTRRAYATDLASFFGSLSVSLNDARRVSFTEVNEYVATLQSRGRAVSTVRRQLVAVRGFFAWLVALGQLPLNPADTHLIRRIPKQNASDHAITVLTAEAAHQLLESVDYQLDTAVRDHALMSVLLHCVLRRSEAAEMNVEHIRTVGPYTVLGLPMAKGGANQTVKIPDHVAIVLRDMIDHYGFHAGPVWRSMSRNASAGKRLSGTSIYSIVNQHAVKAGIMDVVGAHTLRHTGCTLAIEGGASIQQVQTHARHRSISTTMLYVHQRDRLAHSAADFIRLGSAPPPPEPRAGDE